MRLSRRPAGSKPLPRWPTNVTVVANGRHWATSVTGSNNAWFQTRNWQFEDAELQAGSAVCVIGETVRRHLFNTRSALGEQLRIK